MSHHNLPVSCANRKQPTLSSNRQSSQLFRIAYTTITLLAATPSAFLDLLPRFGIFPGYRSSLRAFSDSAPASLAERSTRLSQQLLEVGRLNVLFLVVESRSPRVQPDERVAVQLWRFLDSDKRYAVVSFFRYYETLNLWLGSRVRRISIPYPGFCFFSHRADLTDVTFFDCRLEYCYGRAERPRCGRSDPVGRRAFALRRSCEQ